MNTAWNYLVLVICVLAFINSGIQLFRIRSKNSTKSNNDKETITSYKSRYYILLLIVSVWIGITRIQALDLI